MKLSFSIFLLIAFIVVSSCSETTSVTQDTESEFVEAERIDDMEFETPPPAPELVEQRTVTGKFKSVAGVMDELSCFCENGGYVTSEDGTVTTVCFDEAVESCDKITLTGYMTTRKIEANDSCPAGMMGFLKVQEYVIGETDY